MSSPAATPHGAQGPGQRGRAGRAWAPEAACAATAGHHRPDDGHHRRALLTGAGHWGSTGAACATRHTGTPAQAPGAEPPLPASPPPERRLRHGPHRPRAGSTDLPQRRRAAPHHGGSSPWPVAVQRAGAGGRAGSGCRTALPQERPRSGPADAQARPGPPRAPGAAAESPAARDRARCPARCRARPLPDTAGPTPRAEGRQRHRGPQSQNELTNRPESYRGWEGGCETGSCLASEADVVTSKEGPWAKEHLGF